MAAIKRDKKVVHGRLHFVLAIEIGATTTIDDVTEEELRAVLRRLGLSDQPSSGPGTPEYCSTVSCGRRPSASRCPVNV